MDALGLGDHQRLHVDITALAVPEQLDHPVSERPGRVDRAAQPRLLRVAVDESAIPDLNRAVQKNHRTGSGTHRKFVKARKNLRVGHVSIIHKACIPLNPHVGFRAPCQHDVVDDVWEPSLVPELAVRDLKASLHFWCDLIGFAVRYDRPDEGFAYLTLGRAHLLLDQIGLGRTWETGDLEPPLGRGLNLQVSVADLAAPLSLLATAGWPLFLQPEEKWYRVGGENVGVSQFLVQDPDGYLLRLQAPTEQPDDPQAVSRAVEA